MGYEEGTDANGNVSAATANMGLIQARSADVATRGSRQLQIAAGLDATRMAIAQLAHPDRRAALALRSVRPQIAASRTGQAGLSRPRRLESSKANFDTFYRGQQSPLADQLKNAARRVGLFAGPAANEPTHRVHNRATGENGTILRRTLTCPSMTGLSKWLTLSNLTRSRTADSFQPDEGRWTR